MYKRKFEKYLQKLYFINRLAKIVRDKEDYFSSELLYKLKNFHIYKIIDKGKLEKHILYLKEDKFGKYDYYFILVGKYIEYKIGDRDYGFHFELKRRYYINEDELKNIGRKIEGEIPINIEENRTFLIKNKKVESILKDLGMDKEEINFLKTREWYRRRVKDYYDFQ